MRAPRHAASSITVGRFRRLDLAVRRPDGPMVVVRLAVEMSNA
jgi:hypothetical protein